MLPTFVLIFFGHLLQAQGRLVVSVVGINETKGSVLVGLFKTKETFLSKPAYGKAVTVDGNELVAVFEGLEAGEYGVSVIHDLNGNSELDTNSLGIPKEGFAFGNNAMGVFGPPSFEKAKVVIGSTEVRMNIRMRYF